MKSSQSNFNLRSPGSYLARSYLIATVCMALFCWIWARLVVLFWRQITTTHTISIFLIFLGSSFVVETCKTAHFNNLFSELSQCNRSNIILQYFRVQTRKLGQLTRSKQARKFGLHDRSEVPYRVLGIYNFAWSLPNARWSVSYIAVCPWSIERRRQRRNSFLPLLCCSRLLWCRCRLLLVIFARTGCQTQWGLNIYWRSNS